MDEAERCDHVALLDRGRIVALDTPEALQRSLAGDMVALRASDARRAIDILRRTPAVRRAELFGDTLHVTLASRARDWPVVQQGLAAAGIEVSGVQEIEPSLEDVFIDRVADASAGQAA